MNTTKTAWPRQPQVQPFNLATLHSSELIKTRRCLAGNRPDYNAIQPTHSWTLLRVIICVYTQINGYDENINNAKFNFHDPVSHKRVLSTISSLLWRCVYKLLHHISREGAEAWWAAAFHQICWSIVQVMGTLVRGLNGDSNHTPAMLDSTRC